MSVKSNIAYLQSETELYKKFLEINKFWTLVVILTNSLEGFSYIYIYMMSDT
jgi:hypothetical protein